MDEKIISKAELKMKELYGEQLPISISNRFKTEELMLKNQMMLRWMGFLGVFIRGFETPFSHFDTALSETPTSAPNWY